MTELTMILEPTAPACAATAAPQRTLNSLRGKVIGFIDNTKPNFDLLADDMADLLVREHAAAGIVRHRKHAVSSSATDAMLEEVRAKCDLVIAGSGD